MLYGGVDGFSNRYISYSEVNDTLGWVWEKRFPITPDIKEYEGYATFALSLGQDYILAHHTIREYSGLINSRIGFRRFDSLGNIIWDRIDTIAHFGVKRIPSEHNFIDRHFDILLLPSNNILSFSVFEKYRNQTLWMTKYSELGAVLPYCKELNAATNLKDISTAVLAYPNPSRGNISFKIEKEDNVEGEIVITNILGRKIAAFAIQNNVFDINLNQLPNGIYTYKIKWKNGEFAAGKIQILN